ncbi:sensor domain-containing diguanylate cyclase [Longivirga aurantiaca]|uniref:GGDEF domain-containing protein n=1 Tax=Longivirga aurantiaca TaxID=1837743 RepID=A0ABW1SXB9_9ACTN
MFHEHERARAATVDLTDAVAPAPQWSAGRARSRRAALELAAITALAWVAVVVLNDPSREAWTQNDHRWLVPVLVLLAVAGNRVRARLGRSRGERTVVFDATGAALIGAVLLLPPLWFPVVALASAWRPDRRRLTLNTAIRVTAMSVAMLAYELATFMLDEAGLLVDTVRVAGLLAAGAAYLATEAVVHRRHLDEGDGLGDEIPGLGAELVRRDSPGVALGLLVVALLAVSPVTAVLLVPLAWLVVQMLRAQEQLLLAGTDYKTGLLTYESFRRCAAAEIARARRQARPLVAVMVDLDGMKSVNTLHGHLTGEIVLASIGAVLRGAMRAEDVVARFGGDEFCLLLPDTDLEGALVLVERLRVVVATTALTPGDEPLYRTASFGLTGLRIVDDVDSLLGRADSALSRAKEAGKDRLAYEL